MFAFFFLRICFTFFFLFAKEILFHFLHAHPHWKAFTWYLINETVFLLKMQHYSCVHFVLARVLVFFIFSDRFFHRFSFFDFQNPISFSSVSHMVVYLWQCEQKNGKLLEQIPLKKIKVLYPPIIQHSSQKSIST